jgi:hypothetical protein
MEHNGSGIGTLFGGKPVFPSGELCDIIETCGEAGVRELQLPGLIVKFGPQAPTRPVPSGPHPTTLPLAEPEDGGLTEEAIKQAQEELEKTSLEQLLIENPAEYERVVSEGILKDV